MNEEALVYSYDLFKKDGYNGTLEDYKELIQSNPEALNYSYDLFKKDGYADSIEEFQSLVGLKKKEDTALPSEDGLSEPQDSEDSFLSQLGRNLRLGSVELGEGMAALPATIYRIAAAPQNYLADVLDMPSLKASPEKIEELTGVRNRILDYYEEEGDKLSKEVELYALENYEKQGIVESLKEKNYNDAFKQLAEGVTRSAPFSISMMVGGAATSLPRLSAIATPVFMGPEIKKQEAKGKGEFEALGNAFVIGAAETVFSSIGSGTIGSVYKDIILREGAEQGAKIFRSGLVEMYKSAIKKYGIAAGALGEGIEEVATLMTQNLANDLPVFQGVGDAFIQGVAGGGLYTSPISAINAKNRIQSEIAKSKVNRELEGSNYNNIEDVFRDYKNVDDVTTNIVRTKNADKFLKSQLKFKVSSGEITQDEANELLNYFNRTKSVVEKANRLDDVSDEAKKQIASLLIEKQDVERKIQTIDDSALSQKDFDNLKEINNKLAILSSGGTIETTPVTETPVLESEEASGITAGLADIAADYLFTGGRDVMLSTDYFLQALVSTFRLAGNKIDSIRNKYARDLGNIRDDVGTENYENVVQEIRDALNESYQGDARVQQLFDQVVSNATGFIPRVGRRVSSEIESINDQYEVEISDRIKSTQTVSNVLNRPASPEQAEFVNQQLEQDEEFQNELRKITEPTEEQAAPDTEQVTEQPEEVVDVETEAESFIESVGKKPLFQKEQAATVEESDTEAITEEMNNLSDERAEFDVPSNLTTKNKTNVKSLKDRFGDAVKVIKDMSFFEGIPFMFTISDQLTTGKWTSPFTGKTFDFYGGLGFNMVNPGNAWANVTENTANQTLSTAKGIYEKNKELFDRLWSEGKLPNGHVPMAVIKMGQNSIESNEALFRIISDNITTNFDEAQRVEAKNILEQEVAKKNPSEKITDFLSKYTTIDQVLDNITELPLTSRAEVRSLVMYGAPSIGAPTKPGLPNSPVLKYLLEGRDASDRSLFHLPTINDSVREESTKNIPEGHVISVVGVDVLNPSVTSAANGDFTHQNYGFGVKGQLIGVIEKPSHAADIFPEMYSKSVRTFKEDKKGKLPSPKMAVDQAVAASGAVAIIKAFKGAAVSTKMTTLNVVLGKLRQAFPSVTVVNTKEEFDAVVNSPSVKKYSRDGEIIYGFTLDGRVFLNPDVATTNTAIHEYGHIWLNFIEEFNPSLLKKGFDLLNGTDILAEKIKIHGDNRTARMEALADLIGNRGESLVNAAQKSRFKNWLNAVFTYVKSKFKAFNDINADEFQSLTLNQFVDGILSDLLSGKEVTSKQVRSVEVQFQKADINNLIERGISEGFSKEAIKLGLEKLGYDTSNFNKEFSAIRESFEDIQEKASEPRKVKVSDIWDKSDKAIKDKLKSKGVDYYKAKTRELLLDRQTRIKRLLNGIGSKEAQRAANLLVTKAGGSGYANFRFEKADKKIFKGLSVEDRKTLDQIVYARRIDAINENRKSRGLESYVGVEGFSQEDAKRELNEIKLNIGEEKFRDLSSRATEYFKVFDESLNRMRDADLISEDVYNQLKDTEYSPIKTIKYLIPDDYDANETDRMAQITGMPKSVIQSLSDGNVNDIIMDSRWLLETNVSMIEARVFENRMLNSFYDAVQGADADQKIAINDYVKDNPQQGTYKTGKPKYKYDTVKTPVGFVRVPFIRNGNKVEMIISEAYAKQLLDIKTTPSLLGRTIPKLTGTSILRFFATSGNPLFIVGNTAVDFANILFLSDVYSNNKFTGGAKLAADSIKTFLSKIGGTEAYNKSYKEYMEHGGSMDYLSTDGLKAIQSINPKGRFLEAGTSALRGYGRFMSYLGETSEISFRLAVYEKSKDNQLKEFKKINKREPSAQEMEDIMFAASREARETIDFSQGGSLVKAGDKVLPYLNAATQGFRKAVDYAESNPAGFASSMVQGAIMSGSIAALSMFLLLRSLGEDEDEEKVLEILNSVSDYEKANYHIIFTGNKDEDGEYQYVRVKKLPTISLVATVAENLTTKAILKSRGIDYDVDESILLKNVEGAAPMVPTLKNILSRNPLVSAVVTYQFNYDMFYDQEIFRGPANKKIDPAAEGAFDNRVDQMYKDLAPFFGLSPKRTKAAMEKIITSETTNPMIGLLYSGYDVAFKDGTQIGDEIKAAGDRTLESVSKKLVRKTNSELIRYKQEDLVEKEKIEVDTERYLAEQKMYSEIKKRYKDEKGTFTNEEFLNLIKENFDPIDYKKYAKKYTAYIKNINSDPAILDIIYEDTPEIQAKMIFNKFGDSFEKEEIDAIKKVYNASGRKFSKKGLLIYNRDYKKK